MVRLLLLVRVGAGPQRRGRRHLSRTVDLSEPHLWYRDARKMTRKIICHVGSTNSGKTYNALNALMYAKTGIYCGPLRLLAWEVSEKMREKDIVCSLLTGQEKDLLEGATHVSSTVEMVDLRRRYDVAVIDECQLMGDPSRGWAWTNAVLGVQAAEVREKMSRAHDSTGRQLRLTRPPRPLFQVHLCGSPSMLPIVHDLCALTKVLVAGSPHSLPLPTDPLGLTTSPRDLHIRRMPSPSSRTPASPRSP